MSVIAFSVGFAAQNGRRQSVAEGMSHARKKTPMERMRLRDEFIGARNLDEHVGMQHGGQTIIQAAVSHCSMQLQPFQSFDKCGRAAAMTICGSACKVPLCLQ